MNALLIPVEGAPYYGQVLEPTVEETRDSFIPIVAAAAPVIAEAGYRAGIEDARELVDALTHLRGLKLSSPSEQLYGISADAFGAVAVAHDRLAAALSDTEGRDE